MDSNDRVTALKRAYYKNYRERNRERIAEKRKEWFENNPDKRKEYNGQYWEKKALKASGQ